MRRVLTALLLLALLAAGAVLLFPVLRRAWALAELTRRTMPVPLPVPVEGVRPAQLTDTWGAARSGGRRHEGIDIFAPCGTPVLSATEGVVLTVGEDALGGQVVRVFGPGGHAHYYAHLGRFGDLREGDRVQPGDTLGYVGDTGNARGTPCHLHYGIYARGGGARNPYPLLAGPDSAGSRTSARPHGVRAAFTGRGGPSWR
ncbi:MAG TPA: M23 family metallopeptidase [Longimicrobiaceae bacterium]|nr:M23 family metallopeptidase [Longimicrobiaceae bacterium]